MAPIVHCVRHAQGYHNLTVANHSIPDPLLTELGENQCRTLQSNFPNQQNIDLIVASPLRRTIYTAYFSFEDVIKEKKLTIVGLPETQETSDVPCDTGSDVAILAKEVEDKKLPVDLSLVNDGWNVKQGKYAPTSEAIRNRAREARRWLKARPEKEIVLVTHGGFLHYFTEDWEDSGLYLGTGWVNTEYRSFQFSDDAHADDITGKKLTDGGDDAALLETTESRKRRGKEGETAPREQQKEFFLQGIHAWAEKGLEPAFSEVKAGRI